MAAALVSLPSCGARLQSYGLPELINQKSPPLLRLLKGGMTLHCVDSVGKLNATGHIQLRLALLTAHSIILCDSDGSINRVVLLSAVAQLDLSAAPLQPDNIHPAVASLATAPSLTSLAVQSSGIPPRPGVHWLRIVVPSEYDIVFQTPNLEAWVTAIATLSASLTSRRLPIRVLACASAVAREGRLSRPLGFQPRPPLDTLHMLASHPCPPPADEGDATVLQLSQTGALQTAPGATAPSQGSLSPSLGGTPQSAVGAPSKGSSPPFRGGPSMASPSSRATATATGKGTSVVPPLGGAVQWLALLTAVEGNEAAAMRLLSAVDGTR